MKRLPLFLVIVLSVFSASSQSELTKELAFNRQASLSVNSLPGSSDILHSSTLHINHHSDYALVAGGSKGIGYAIAEALARRGYNLILIARHRDSLLSAKNKFESSYHVHVEILVHDLAKEESAEAIAKWCTDRDIHLKM